MAVFAGVLYSVWTVIKQFFRIFFPFFLVFLIFVIGRMIYRHKKYGYDYFDVFKKRERVDTRRMTMIQMIRKIDPTAFIYEGEHYHSSIVAMTTFGILIIDIFPFQNVRIEGDIDEETLTYWIEKRNLKQSANPFYHLRLDKQQLQMKFPKMPIYEYAVFDTLSVILFSNIPSSFVRMSEVYYQLESQLKEQSLYNVREMEENFKKL